MMVVPWLIATITTLPLYFRSGGVFLWNSYLGLCYYVTKGPYMAAWFALDIYLPVALMGTVYIVLFMCLEVTEKLKFP